MQTKTRPCRGDFFLKINKCADQNKTLQVGFFSQKHSKNTTEPLPMKTIEKKIQSTSKLFPKHSQTGQNSYERILSNSYWTYTNNTCRGEFFLTINKREDQNKAMQGGGIFFSKLINVHACLFGTLEYTDLSKSQKPQ